MARVSLPAAACLRSGAPALRILTDSGHLQFVTGREAAHPDSDLSFEAGSCYKFVQNPSSRRCRDHRLPQVVPSMRAPSGRGLRLRNGTGPRNRNQNPARRGIGA